MRSRSLTQQILIVMLGSLSLLAISLNLVLAWHTRGQAVAAAMVKATSDLSTCTEIIDLTYPGQWHLENNELYKGAARMSDALTLVDRLASLTGNTVTIFQDDIRIATTVRNSDGTRALNTTASQAVVDKVLKKGEMYLGEANVVGNIYQTAYMPLYDPAGMIIGMFYVGLSSDYAQQMITDFLVKSGFIGAGVTLIIGLITWFSMHRFIITPLRDITLGTRDVVTGHNTPKVVVKKPFKEISELAVAFNQLVEKMDTLSGQLNKAGPSSDIKSPEIFEYDGALKGEEIHADPHHESAHDDTVFKTLPKGLNHATLRQISMFLNTIGQPVSVEDVAEGVKLTRVTVRRYLEYLEQCGVLSSELKYGTVGRPLKLFSKNTG